MNFFSFKVTYVFTVCISVGDCKWSHWALTVNVMFVMCV